MTNDARARSFFPRMPVEIFDVWIQPQINTYGWPFTSINSSTISTRWYDFFFGRKLSYFRDLTWSKSLALIDSFPLNHDSWKRLRDLTNHCTGRDKTGRWKVENSVQRFIRAGAFITQNRTIPGCIILIKDEESYVICDGHHRIAAWVESNLARSIKIPVWVGISN